MKFSSLPAAISFEIQPDLYEPGADWTDASQYPEIKALDAFSSKDYQRLAWEVLRRMPLYRLHWKELNALGITNHFLFGRRSFLSEVNDAELEQWRDVSIVGHVCVPPAAPHQKTLGAYIYDKPGDWHVVSRNMWVRDYWGLKGGVPDWQRTWSKLPATGFLSPPVGAALVLRGNTKNRRARHEVSVGANELLVALRLDVPVELQLSALRPLLNQAKKDAKIAPTSAVLVDLAFVPGVLEVNNWRPMRTPLRAEDFGERQSILLKQLELSPLWLRTWDLMQSARREQGISSPRVMRSDVIQRFRADYRRILAGPDGSKSIDLLAAKYQRRRKAITLWDALNSSLNAAMVPKWQIRSEKYIEQGDQAFRQIAALAFA